MATSSVSSLCLVAHPCSSPFNLVLQTSKHQARRPGICWLSALGLWYLHCCGKYYTHLHTYILITFVQLLNESIPHIIAAFLTHVLSTIWSGFQLAHTAAFRRNFNALTVDGACRGINLLPGYWSARAGAEVRALVTVEMRKVTSIHLDPRSCSELRVSSDKRLSLMEAS